MTSERMKQEDEQQINFESMMVFIVHFHFFCYRSKFCSFIHKLNEIFVTDENLWICNLLFQWYTVIQIFTMAKIKVEVWNRLENIFNFNTCLKTIKFPFSLSAIDRHGLVLKICILIPYKLFCGGGERIWEK